MNTVSQQGLRGCLRNMQDWNRNLLLYLRSNLVHGVGTNNNEICTRLAPSDEQHLPTVDRFSPSPRLLDNAQSLQNQHCKAEF